MLDFDFSLLDNKEFKEDSVREDIIAPLLKELGFESKKSQEGLTLKRSVKLTSDTILGSNKSIKSKDLIIPDYVLYIDGKPHCVLDAKKPNVDINSKSKSERQAFYYAINPKMQSPFYALCNGRSLTLYQTSNQELILEIDLNTELNSKFELLKQYLITPIASLRQNISSDNKKPKKSDDWYLGRTLPKPINKPKKLTKARYYGCTAYFTRQSWDIVALNIKNFTDEGDVVFDPFGGTGVTAIESMINNRLGIHTDLNPLSIFMTKALTSKVDLGDLYDLGEEILSEFEKLKPKNEKEAKAMLENAKYFPNAINKEFGNTASVKKQEEILWIPKDEELPKGSDVDSVLKLFSTIQLVELAILRKLIMRKTTKNKEMRYSLLLAFRNTITNCNLTFHTSKPDGITEQGGNSGVFIYYRYRIAKKPTIVNTANTFRQKIKRVIKGKQELENSIYFYDIYFEPLNETIKNFKGSIISKREDLNNVGTKENAINGDKFFQADATNLKEIADKSIDYIYTDPPYGAKIPYLDLSVMWNAWLDFSIDKYIKEKECIEKGSLNKSRDEYISLMKNSIKEMYRVLKFNRWLSFVFQHQDPQLWQLLVDAAEEVGFEYVGSVRQNNGQTTFKKRQNPFSVLSEQLILHFKKVDNPKTRIKDKVGDTFELALNNIEALIARDNGATLEEINSELQTRGLELGFLHELSEMFNDLTTFINQNFDYDNSSGKYHIRQGEKFKSQIDIKVRAKYFILSFLRGAERRNEKSTFDDICLEVIPLLKNGITPDEEYIKDILEEVAIPNKTTGEWKLKTDDPKLFDDI